MLDDNAADFDSLLDDKLRSKYAGKLKDPDKDLSKDIKKPIPRSARSAKSKEASAKAVNELLSSKKLEDLRKTDDASVEAIAALSKDKELLKSKLKDNEIPSSCSRKATPKKANTGPLAGKLHETRKTGRSAAQEKLIAEMADVNELIRDFEADVKKARGGLAANDYKKEHQDRPHQGGEAGYGEIRVR